MKKLKSKVMIKGIACLTSAMLLFSCQFETLETSSFKEKEFKEDYKLVDNADSPVYKFDVKMLYADTASQAGNAINKVLIKSFFDYENLTPLVALDSFILHMKGNYRKDMLSIYQSQNEKDRNAGMFMYYYRLNTSVQDGYNNCLCYTVRTETFLGGAHGMYFTQYFNFNKENGKLIRLGDIMIPDYEVQLEDMLLQKLFDQFDVKSIGELEENGILLSGQKFYITDNFCLGSDSVLFTYNPYDIACYAAGAIDIKLSYDELTSILR